MEKQKAQQHEEYMAPLVFTNGICHHPKQESISPKYGISMNKIAATPKSARAVRHGFQYKKILRICKFRVIMGIMAGLYERCL